MNSCTCKSTRSYTCTKCGGYLDESDKDGEITRLETGLRAYSNQYAKTHNELSTRIEGLEVELKEAHEDISILRGNLNSSHKTIEEAKTELKTAKEEIARFDAGCKVGEKTTADNLRDTNQTLMADIARKDAVLQMFIEPNNYLISDLMKEKAREALSRNGEK